MTTSATRAVNGGARDSRWLLDAVLVLLLAVPFYYYLRAAVKEGFVFRADTPRYLWADVVFNVNYFFNSSPSVRVLYTLVGNVPKNVVKLQVLMLALAQIALFLSLRRGGFVQRMILAGALALFFASTETHLFARHGLADSPHFSLWILFACTLAAYRGRAANLVIVIAGILFVFSKNTAPYLALGMTLFYFLLNIRVWRRLDVLPALVILLSVSIGGVWVVRHLNTAIEHHTTVRYFSDVFPSRKAALRFHEDHGMPLGPLLDTCKAQFTLVSCVDLERILAGNAHSHEYEITHDDYGFVDWMRARGIDVWQQHLLASGDLYRSFLRSFPEKMALGIFSGAVSQRFGAIPALTAVNQRLGFANPRVILLLIALGTLWYWILWRDRVLVLPLLLMTSGFAGFFLAFAGDNGDARHFWPGGLNLYLGIVFILWAFVEGLARRLRARGAGDAAAEMAEEAGAPPRGTQRWLAPQPISFAVLLVGLSAFLFYRYGDHLRQAPLPLAEGVQTATYGLAAHEATAAAALLPDGDLVVVGRVLEPERTAANFVHAGEAGRGYDVFVARIDAALSRPVTYAVLGGGDDDHATDVVVGRDGDIYVSGFTRSTDFPGMATGMTASRLAAQADGFVVRLTPDLSRIKGAIRLGGSDHDAIRALAVDDTGRVYAAGTTASADFPVPPTAAYRERVRPSWELGPDKNHSLEYGMDGFVVRLDVGLTGVEAGTYFGGSGDELVSDLVLDGGGGAFVVGTTSSVDFPAVQGPYAPTRTSRVNAFVARLDMELSSLTVATVFGGIGQDYARCAVVAPDGDLLVGGYRRSDHRGDFPTTPGAFQERSGGGNADGWVVRVSRSKLELIAASFLSGNNADYIYDIATDRDGQVLVTGYTNSIEDFPGIDVESGRFFDQGRTDMFVSRLSPDLTQLSSTILAGGHGWDRSAALVQDRDGGWFIAGDTGTRDFPVTNHHATVPPGKARHDIAVLRLPPVPGAQPPAKPAPSFQ